MILESQNRPKRSITQWKFAPRHQHYWNEVERHQHYWNEVE